MYIDIWIIVVAVLVFIYLIYAIKLSADIFAGALKRKNKQYNFLKKSRKHRAELITKMAEELREFRGGSLSDDIETYIDIVENDYYENLNKEK